MEIVVSDNCTGCGLCVKDCSRNVLSIKTRKVLQTRSLLCNACGHCVAICPANALTITSSGKADPAIPLFPYKAKEHGLLPQICMRRSIRHFTNRLIPKDLLLSLLEAGRYAPTACNFQGTSFSLIRNDPGSFREVILHQLYDDALSILKNDPSPLEKTRAEGWIENYMAWKKNASYVDNIFFDAPHILTIITPDERDAGICAAYIELHATSLGLGVLYNGNLSNAINHSQEAKYLLGMKQEDHAAISLLLGYPAVRYQRPAPRKALHACHLDLA